MSLQVAGDIGGAQHLPADVAGNFALMADHVRAQTVFGSESRRAGRYLAFKRSFCGVNVLNVTAEMIWPGEALSTDRADIRFMHTPVV